ncbi:MAG: hypothetical protein GY841_08205 [FCB group bacterium]|nr:hypothetical protein [FCB group bacterium]
MINSKCLLIAFLLSTLFCINLQAAALMAPDKGDGEGYAQDATYDSPNWGIEVHKINNIWLAVSNGGTFGIGFSNSEMDPETGEPAPSCEYPAGSDITYLYIASFWAGAVVGRDTLVTVGFDGNRFVSELWPDAGDKGAIVRLSNMKTSLEYSLEAVSEQDFVCSYTDTFTDPGLTGTDPFDNRRHLPLGLKIQQRTYGWSYDYSEDFIIFDYTIENINQFPLKQIYFGLYVDADVYHESGQSGGWSDDICGYVHSMPSVDMPCYEDTVRIAWTADNDGDPNPTAGNVLDFHSPAGLTGTAVLRTPKDDLQYSFNWWIANSNAEYDWGPRMAATPEKPFRDFGTGMGSPNGDLNKYYVMSSNEFDYDQLESAVSHTSQGFMAPPSRAEDFADGYDARYLFSFGPFDLQPGDTIPITLAYVAGSGFHQYGEDFEDYWNPYQPQLYQDQLSFADLGNNAKWAHWIFDNPGVDTDNDGDSGDFIWVCEWPESTVCLPGDQFTSDTSVAPCRQYFVSGDGVPDFRGASPPPPPPVKVFPDYETLRIRWNGDLSENNIDIFSGLKDFEGYRVYYGEDNRISDYVLLATYDLNDYNMYYWDQIAQRWEITEFPLTMDSLKNVFGNDFNPLLYPDAGSAMTGDGGTFYYFVPVEWNDSDLSDKSGIYRVYPDADPNDRTDTTEDGYRRYYEYEFVIDNLQPSKLYWATVTAFDFGSRKIALSSLESALNLNSVMAYPLPSTELVEERGLQVAVYPNPYRIDGGYASAGYENRDRTKSAERARAIHFVNLPHICKIRIFSLNGDLVQEIDHYRPDGDPDAQHEKWNLISRNTQAVVTGIYIYHVSSDMGEQVGKIVIMK